MTVRGTPTTTSGRQRASGTRARNRRMGRRGVIPVRVMEHGDVFFFYRPRVETEEVATREDVQRFFIVLAAERANGTSFRMFAVGRKQLPDVRPGEAHPEERNWAVNVLTTSKAEDVRGELLAKEYSTATRGV